jgi:hypothetical protein
MRMRRCWRLFIAEGITRHAVVAWVEGSTGFTRLRAKPLIRRSAVAEIMQIVTLPAFLDPQRLASHVVHDAGARGTFRPSSPSVLG